MVFVWPWMFEWAAIVCRTESGILQYNPSVISISTIMQNSLLLTFFEYPINTLCTIFSILKSTYYYLLKVAAVVDSSPHTCFCVPPNLFHIGNPWNLHKLTYDVNSNHILVCCPCSRIGPVSEILISRLLMLTTITFSSLWSSVHQQASPSWPPRRIVASHEACHLITIMLVLAAIASIMESGIPWYNLSLCQSATSSLIRNWNTRQADASSSGRSWK